MTDNFKYIGELPIGYVYRLIKLGDALRVVGISHFKKPVIFDVVNGNLIDITKIITKETIDENDFYFKEVSNHE